MKRIAILTSLNMPNLMPYDIEVLRNLNSTDGITAEPVIWETEAEKLRNYDIAIFRTTWGYHEKASEFWEFINFMDGIGLPTLNPLHIIRQNFHKFYLKELASGGIEIIPTEFVVRESGQNIKEIISEKGWEKFIIKPAVSAGSYSTHLCDAADIKAAIKIFNTMNITNDLLIQKFLPEVITKGEFSTIFFSGGYHYTVNKIPQTGDYRVQSNFGGKYQVVKPNNIIFESSEKIASKFLNDCLYVRVDGLFTEDKFLLMEAEMLEPDLYMNIYPQAIPEFVKSILNRIQNI